MSNTQISSESAHQTSITPSTRDLTTGTAAHRGIRSYTTPSIRQIWVTRATDGKNYSPCEEGIGAGPS